MKLDRSGYPEITLPPLKLRIGTESFALARPFRIARGSKMSADVLTVMIDDGQHQAMGEAVPYARYDESLSKALAQLRPLIEPLAEGRLRWPDLGMRLPPGAARNALDCALWDYWAKYSGQSVADLLGLPTLCDQITAFTISLDHPDIMAQQAAQAAQTLPLLKLKLGDPPLDAERITRCRAAAPKARLIIDANEGWGFDDLVPMAVVAQNCGIELIEQPLPAHLDVALGDYDGPVPLCADESCHGDDPAQMRLLSRFFQAVNLKLDKLGGLSPALPMIDAARDAGLDLFIGSMVASSLALCPALLLASHARWVDLDGPLLLAQDRSGGLIIENGVIKGALCRLWGHA
ncbi:L-Ala-D/L-Glu epimerase [alpha proteobacterium Q-1]|nr:dipeptide epimerase [Iodidimonas nitroreducens]GAK33781.1 L-Ala-D/L-Glu epimerase [alpha proteobacterium Q-1]